MARCRPPAGARPTAQAVEINDTLTLAYVMQLDGIHAGIAFHADPLPRGMAVWIGVLFIPHIYELYNN